MKKPNPFRVEVQNHDAAYWAFIAAAADLLKSTDAKPGEWHDLSCRLRLEDDGRVSVVRLSMLGPEEDEPA
jgi:hypothetical protein